MRGKLGDGGDPKIKVPRKGMDPHGRAQLFERVLSGSVLKVGDAGTPVEAAEGSGFLGLWVLPLCLDPVS